MTAFKSMYHLTKLYDDPSLINKVLELGKKSFNNNDVSTMIIIFVIGVITSVVFVFISNSINKYYGPIINSILYVFAFLYLYNLIFYSTILILTETMILKLFIVITIIGFYGLIGNVIYNIYKVVKNNFNKKNSLIKIGQRD
jgi:predicted neutral ceramidase superfamily lipid hydrolase